MDSLKDQIEFEVGEYVWNENVGVCVITEIETRDKIKVAYVDYIDNRGMPRTGWDKIEYFKKLSPLMKELV